MHNRHEKTDMDLCVRLICRLFKEQYKNISTHMIMRGDIFDEPPGTRTPDNLIKSVVSAPL